jgi:hypothetical protein
MAGGVPGVSALVSGFLTVTSTPAGASVFIDGTYQGITPLNNFQINPGQHNIRLSLNGYFDKTDVVTITSEKKITGIYSLTPVPITTTPTPAYVTCHPPYECLLPNQADTKWGTGKYTQGDANPCGQTANTVQKTQTPPLNMYCYVQTSSPPIQVITTTPVPGQVQPLKQVIAAKQVVPAQPAKISGVVPVQKNQVSLTNLSNEVVTPAQVIVKNGGEISPEFYSPYFQIPSDTILEIDTNNIDNLPDWIRFGMPNIMHEGTGDVAGHNVKEHGVPVWENQSTIKIALDCKTAYANLRWFTDTEQVDPIIPVKGLWQISREPFPVSSSNPPIWQNQYIPGLVGSGPVEELSVDSQGHHYFRINFAEAANHNPQNHPYYDGFLFLSPDDKFTGTPQQITKFPMIGYGMVTKNINIGHLSIPIPKSVLTIPPGALTESDVGNPNDNMSLFTGAERATLYLDTLELSRNFQEFYIRFVPMDASGKVGIPTIPVTIFLKRPLPCPTCPPANTDVLVKPPTVKITQFYYQRDSILMIPPQFDSDGNPTNDQFYEVIKNPKGCWVTDLPRKCPSLAADCPEHGGLDKVCQDIVMHMKGANAVGFHYVIHPIPPADTPWYVKIYNFFQDPFNIIATLGHYWDFYPQLWSWMQALAIESGEEIMTYTLWWGPNNELSNHYGLNNCTDMKWCHDFNVETNNAVLSYYGIPRELPSYQELQTQGKEYLKRWLTEYIKEKVSEGYSDYADDIQQWYDSLPDEAKAAIGQLDSRFDIKKQVQDKLQKWAEDHAEEYADKYVEAWSYTLEAHSASIYMTQDWKIPDPLYYTYHQAYIVFNVSNPNDYTSDPVTLTIYDTNKLYYETDKVIPPLKPHDDVTVTMLLTYKPTTQWLHEKGLDASDSTPHHNVVQTPDTFTIKLSTDKSTTQTPKFTINNLESIKDGDIISPQNQWILLPTDEQENCPQLQTCKNTITIRYPPNWQVSYTPLVRTTNTEAQKEYDQLPAYTFTEGTSGFMGPGPQS